MPKVILEVSRRNSYTESVTMSLLTVVLILLFSMYHHSRSAGQPNRFATHYVKSQ
jgi:F0F1-type ATP synthase membrane subunit a